jgi:hypothetical protein
VCRLVGEYTRRSGTERPKHFGCAPRPHVTNALDAEQHRRNQNKLQFHVLGAAGESRHIGHDIRHRIGDKLHEPDHRYSQVVLPREVGHTQADHDIGVHVEIVLRAARRETEAGIHLVENQRHAALAADRAEPFEPKPRNSALLFCRFVMNDVARL